jgi:hypothetical protein
MLDLRGIGGLINRAFRSNSRQILLLLVAVVGLTTIYALTGPENRSEAEDAFWLADDIENGTLRTLFGPDHTAHLLFLPLGRGLFNIARLLSIDVRAYDAVRLANCLLAGAAVVLFGSVLRRRLRLSLFAAISGAAGLAVSYGFWRYANETEVYAVAILFIVLLCFVAFSGLRSTLAVIVAGAVAAIGMLIHILGAIPAVIVVPFILLLERRVRDVAVYILGCGVLAGTISYAAYRYAAPPKHSFAGYLLGQSPDSEYAAQALPASVLSVAQDVATSNFLFAHTGIAQRIVAAFPAQYLVEEQYAGMHSDNIVRTVPLITVSMLLLLFIVVVWFMRGRLLEFNRLRRIANPLAAVTIWIVAYWLIVIGPSSSAPEAWIPLLPAVWLIIAVVLFDIARGRTERMLVMALLAALLVHNLAGGFWMMRSKSTDFNVIKARWLLENAHNGDVILTADGAVFERYLRYYTQAKVISLEELSSSQLSSIYSATVPQPGRVFATESVLYPPSELRAMDQASFHAIEQFSSNVRHEFRKVLDDDVGDVYVRR